MIKKFFSLIAVMAIVVACSPKTGNKTSNSPATATASLVSKAPIIPIPSGDVRKNAPQPGTAPKIQIGKAEQFQLDNGLTVIVVENHKLPKVSYRLFVDTDPVLEKEAAGYIDMFGELLAKGTSTKSKTQIDEEVDFIGASFSTDANGLSGSCLNKHSEKLLSIMSDALLNPTFPDEELDKSKKRAESGLASQKNDASAMAGVVASRLRYGKTHPYGENMTEQSLANIKTDLIKSYYKTYFKPNISYLIVTGDVSRAKAEAQAKQYFGKWAKDNVPKHTYPTPLAPEKNQVSFVHKPGAVQSVINVTYPVDLKPGSPDAIRARVANTLLGAYFNSRLNNNLRENHGWTYGAGSSLNPDILVGSFTAYASVRNAVTDSSIVEILKEMKRLGDEVVSNEELQVVKNFIAGQFARNLEEPGTVANFALNIARYQLPQDYYEKYLETLQNVSAEEVQAMAKKYIRPDRAHILVVGNRDEVADRLKQFSPDGKINFYNAYGNPVKQNNEKVPTGLTAEQIVEDYLNAIGGRKKIESIQDMYSEATMQMRGPSFSVKTYHKGRNKIAIEMSMNGQPMNKQTYDGTQGIQSGMGQVEILQGEQLENLKEQAMICKETNYKTGGYKLTLKGIEEANSSPAYVIEVERADGKKSTEYYDTKSSLKVREISIGQGIDGNPSTQILDLTDYQETDGIKLPRSMTVSGVFPVPFKVTVSKIQINNGVDDAVFKQ